MSFGNWRKAHRTRHDTRDLCRARAGASRREVVHVNVEDVPLVGGRGRLTLPRAADRGDDCS